MKQEITPGSFWGYTVSRGDIKTTNWGIFGEYVLDGKRGAKYLTYRRVRDGVPSQYVEFISYHTGNFVALYGNKVLDFALIERAAPEQVAA